ncbi:MAG TPA: hypothetical protein VH593_16390, partial [Ktedonobacteraceae bacterium]
MRIRNYRQEDLSTVVQIERLAREVDGREALDEAAFISWLLAPSLNAADNVFVITNDDDELQTWGQAGTLEGIEGEIVGYTSVQLQRDAYAFHILCQGTVYPPYRKMHAGRALLICALNRARILELDVDFEAEQAGLPVYFEALLPMQDPMSTYLAARCEMQL